MTMPKPAPSTPALPIAHVVLRILTILNWVMVPVILALLFVIPNREWIMSALKLDPSLEADRVVMGLRSIAALGLVAIARTAVVASPAVSSKTIDGHLDEARSAARPCARYGGRDGIAHRQHIHAVH